LQTGVLYQGHSLQTKASGLINRRLWYVRTHFTAPLCLTDLQHILRLGGLRDREFSDLFGYLIELVALRGAFPG